MVLGVGWIVGGVWVRHVVRGDLGDTVGVFIKCMLCFDCEWVGFWGGVVMKEVEES